MTDPPTLLYTSTCEIPTLLYPWSLKKVALSGGASPYHYGQPGQLYMATLTKTQTNDSHAQPRTTYTHTGTKQTNN